MHCKTPAFQDEDEIGLPAARGWLLWRARCCAIPELGTAADPPAGPIPFRNAVELALQHSGVMGIAAINQWRARKAYEEVRANYIPQLTIGSGLGYSYGFPLTLEGSAPSVVNFNSVQSLFNLSLRQFMKAAKIDWHATSLDVQDKRDAVILDTALTYAQLAQLTGKIQALARSADGGRESAICQRAALAGRRGQQARGHQEPTGDGAHPPAHRRGAGTVRRVAPASVEPAGSAGGLRSRSQPDSVPQLPAISQDDDLPARAVENSLAVKLAEQKAAAAQARAKGEHKAAVMPTIDLASQYAYLAKFNNYDLYYQELHRQQFQRLA